MPAHAPVEVRFWKYVDKGEPDECWPWIGSKGRKGYGQIRDRGRTLKAHRVSYAIHHGEVPDGAHVLHHCDNPPCCNPAHLFAGSPADNTADAMTKGRLRFPPAPKPGESNIQARLTEADVVAARRLHRDGCNFHELARRFGVDRKTIRQAVRGERWRHV